MKAVLKFDLNDPEDQLDHLRCVKAKNMAITLWDIDQYIRGLVRLDKEDVSVEDLRVVFSCCCLENGIDLEEINR